MQKKMVCLETPNPEFLKQKSGYNFHFYFLFLSSGQCSEHDIATLISNIHDRPCYERLYSVFVQHHEHLFKRIHP